MNHRETRGVYEIYVGRAGIGGEFYGIVEDREGRRVFSTGRRRGAGCKARCLDLCREWVDEQTPSTPAPPA